MITTKEQLAAMLNGREYGNEIDTPIRVLAEDNNLVIVYGASDDLMEFGGAWRDETGSGTAYINSDGLVDIECDNEECPYLLAALKKFKTIKAFWCKPDSPAAWTYETDIPHATFDIMEDGDIYCRGIVFSVEDVGCQREM